MAELARADFDACLDFLAGDLAAPAGAFEPEPGAAPRWTSPRIWKPRGCFGIRSRRVVRWFWSNVGTITLGGVGPCPGRRRRDRHARRGYAERLQSGDRFVLDGRCLEFRRREGLTVHAPDVEASRTCRAGRAIARPSRPSWRSTSPSSARRPRGVLADGPSAPPRLALRGPRASTPTQPRSWSGCSRRRNGSARSPRRATLLVEESPHHEGLTYTFHAPLNRAACEALGRATAARLGRRFGRDLALDGCRPRLVDPAARGDRPPPRGDHATACARSPRRRRAGGARPRRPARPCGSGTSPRRR